MISGPNAGSSPTIDSQFECVISKVEEGSYFGQPSLMMVVYKTISNRNGVKINSRGYYALLNEQ